MRDLNLKYMMDEQGNITTTTDLHTWAEWMEKAKRNIATTEVPGYWVSTVFLGMDHGYFFGEFDAPEPILFETMVFKHNGKEVTDWSEVYMARCATRSEALAQHGQAVAKYQPHRWWWRCWAWLQRRWHHG